MKQFNYQDHYFHEAKKKGYVARSAFKLQEIQDKFGILTKGTKAVLDIGCAPGSRMQYTHERFVEHKVRAQIL
jgi:23S rRNA (uridine2552-2'-O)-methyltransferase